MPWGRSVNGGNNLHESLVQIPGGGYQWMKTVVLLNSGTFRSEDAFPPCLEQCPKGAAKEGRRGLGNAICFCQGLGDDFFRREPSHRPRF